MAQGCLAVRPGRDGPCTQEHPARCQLRSAWKVGGVTGRGGYVKQKCTSLLPIREQHPRWDCNCGCSEIEGESRRCRGEPWFNNTGLCADWRNDDAPSSGRPSALLIPGPSGPDPGPAELPGPARRAIESRRCPCNARGVLSCVTCPMAIAAWSCGCATKQPILTSLPLRVVQNPLPSTAVKYAPRTGTFHLTSH